MNSRLVTESFQENPKHNTPRSPADSLVTAQHWAWLHFTALLNQPLPSLTSRVARDNLSEDAKSLELCLVTLGLKYSKSDTGATDGATYQTLPSSCGYKPFRPGFACRQVDGTLTPV